MILEFSKHYAHSRDRAASRVNEAAVNRARRACVVLRMADHQPGGMKSRCHHLLTWEGVAPTSDANASRECPHNSMIERKESAPVFMPESLGHYVLEHKADLSCDCENEPFDNAEMAKSESEERQAFIDRTRAARLARFEKQAPILILLDLDQGTYKQYESRTPLPHRFIPKFCAATGVDINWLLTGEGVGPSVSSAPQRPRKSRKLSTKNKAA